MGGPPKKRTRIGGYYIPPELTTDILLRLSDARALARFRCVNKQWLCLLTDPSFVHRIIWFDNALDDEKEQTFHVMATNRIAIGTNRIQSGLHRVFMTELLYSLLQCEIGSSSPIRLGPTIANQFDKTGAAILEFLDASKILASVGDCFCVRLGGCCDGIFCMQFESGNSTSSIVQWNPSTRETKILPTFSTTHRLEQIGFGFDSSTRDYKVVAAFVDPKENSGDDEVFTGVYSLRNDSWRNHTGYSITKRSIPKLTVTESHRSRCERVCWWRTLVCDHKIGVVSFDMIEEVFEIHEFPTSLWRSMRCFADDHLQRTEKEFGMVAMFKNSECDREIWGSLDYRVAESWAKLFVVPQSSIPSYCWGLGEIGTTDGSNYMFLSTEGYVFAYDPEIDEDEHIPGVRFAEDMEDRGFGLTDCVTIRGYVPSRVSIASLTAAAE